MRADRADRRADRSAANDYAITPGNDSAQCFASFGIDLKRCVVEPLINLKASQRFGVVGSFVNIGGHRVITKVEQLPTTVVPDNYRARGGPERRDG